MRTHVDQSEPAQTVKEVKGRAKAAGYFVGAAMSL